MTRRSLAFATVVALSSTSQHATAIKAKSVGAPDAQPVPVTSVKATNGTGQPRFLMVTGYWQLDNHKDADQGNLRGGVRGYLKNMPWVMTLNSDQVLYGDEFGLSHMEEARGNNTAPLVGKHLHNFNNSEPCKSHLSMMRANATYWTHPQDCPSINLGCIWDGKMGVMRDAARRHPDYDFYGWVDIGMHASGNFLPIFRSHQDRPWPHPAKLAQLPHDQISVSHSGIRCNRMRERPWEFWHCVAATAFVVPKPIMDRVHSLFYGYLEDCMKFWSDGHMHTISKDGGVVQWGGYGCLSEQMIMSVMAREHPELFNWLGHGWGAAAANLTSGETIFDSHGDLLGGDVEHTRFGDTGHTAFSETLAYGGSSSDLFTWLGTTQEEDAAAKI